MISFEVGKRKRPRQGRGNEVLQNQAMHGLGDIVEDTLIPDGNIQTSPSRFAYLNPNKVEIAETSNHERLSRMYPANDSQDADASAHQQLTDLLASRSRSSE